MNLPNKLTMLRVLLTPVFVAFVLMNEYWAQMAAAAAFGVASLTDLLDGYLARKNDQITDFGKLMDPIADKLLVMAALVCLCYQQRVHVVLVLVLLAREFVISGVRMVAAGKGVVIAADSVGKWKTVCQLVGILLLIVGFGPGLLRSFALILGQVLMIASAALSVWSCGAYIWGNREVFR